MTNIEENIILLKGIIKKLNEVHNKEQSKLYKKLEELVKDCSHSELDEKNEYTSGGYLYESTNTHIIFCKICGKILDEKISYGGYE